MRNFLQRLILVVIGIYSGQIMAQNQEDDDISIRRTAPIIKASERFKPRPKFIEFEYETFNNFRVNANSDVIGDAAATISQNLIRQVKLKFPIILKKNVNLIGGLGYQHEQFKFSNFTEPGYPLFTTFEDKPFKKISASFYLKKNLKNKKFLYVFLLNSLNGDTPQFASFFNQLKSSVAGILGKQVNPNKQVGYGLTFGYALGQPSVFPLFIYNNDMSLHWGLELLLPKSVKLRYSPTNKLHFYATTELQGASYHIQDLEIEGIDKFEFRRSSVRMNLKVEREIHDWLWVGVTAGYRVPINIFLSEPRQNRSNSIVEIDANNSTYYKFSIFIVPPAKIYNRAKGS